MYSSVDEIYHEFIAEIKRHVYSMASDGHYRYETYVKFNPSLNPSPFINIPHFLSKDIIKFRLGIHKLPVNTGLWQGIVDRKQRICKSCNVMGDELHYLYQCKLINRDFVLPNVDELWHNANIFPIFSQLKELELL